MIEQIVIDIDRSLVNDLKSVNEKLNYYRQLSNDGLSNLNDKEFESLKADIERFFNIQFAAHKSVDFPKLYRLSFNRIKKEGGLLDKISQLIGPPLGTSNFNRCNLPGESIFYSSLDLETIIWETQPQKGEDITISEWQSIKGLPIIINGVFNHPDIINANEVSRKIYDDYIHEIDKIHPNQAKIFDSIVKFITEQYIKPVPQDKPKEYLFSSFFSSGILQAETKDTLQIEAIVYPSVKREYGAVNLALLNSMTLKKLKLIAATTYHVVETFYDNAAIGTLPLKMLPCSARVTNFDLENDKIIYPSNQNDFFQWIKKHS